MFRRLLSLLTWCEALASRGSLVMWMLNRIELIARSVLMSSRNHKSDSTHLERDQRPCSWVIKSRADVDVRRDNNAASGLLGKALGTNRDGRRCDSDRDHWNSLWVIRLERFKNNKKPRAWSRSVTSQWHTGVDIRRASRKSASV